MGVYGDYIEPRLVSTVCGLPPLSAERARIVPRAEGRVLEIGFGSGHNARHYNAGKVSHLFALEPNLGWRRLGEKRLNALAFPAEWIDLPGEEIPLDDKSVDTVVTTFCLCTIPNVPKALAGMRRVLKPGGTLLFLEHGEAPDPRVARFQGRLNNFWGKLAGGCHLNRRPDELIREAGFRLTGLDQHYAALSPRFMGYLSAGAAA